MTSVGPGNDDQRTYKDSELRENKEEERFDEGKKNSHNPDDPKDERSIANRLANETKKGDDGKEKTLETKQLQQDATLPARSHGNEPSKGAKIDQMLKEEEEEELRKKGKLN